MHGEIEIATEALRAGASAYVLKHCAVDTLSHAIWEALSGRVFVSPRISRSLSAVADFSHQKDAHAIHLTQREREVRQSGGRGPHHSRDFFNIEDRFPNGRVS